MSEFAQRLIEELNFLSRYDQIFCDLSDTFNASHWEILLWVKIELLADTASSSLHLKYQIYFYCDPELNNARLYYDSSDSNEEELQQYLNYRALGKGLDFCMQKFKDPNVEDFGGDPWKNDNGVNRQVRITKLKKKLSPRTKFIAIMMGTQKIGKRVIALPYEVKPRCLQRFDLVGFVVNTGFWGTT